MSEETTRLTQYSHGAGCGCKIAPRVLESFLKTDFVAPSDPRLLVYLGMAKQCTKYQLNICKQSEKKSGKL